jgi:hypothetical protein
LDRTATSAPKVTSAAEVNKPYSRTIKTQRNTIKKRHTTFFDYRKRIPNLSDADIKKEARNLPEVNLQQIVLLEKACGVSLNTSNYLGKIK